VVAFLVAFAVQWFKRWWWLSVWLPTVGFVALILFDEFVLPYRGGGASMWPLALLFGVPFAIAEAFSGYSSLGYFSRKSERRMRSNNRFESARYAHPTRNGERPLLAAQAER
jgi:hypothetical protein